MYQEVRAKLRKQLVLLIPVVLLLSTSTARAQTTTFTYQGRLVDGGTAANGNYDFQFALFDATAGGTQIGATLTRSVVLVANGVFTVTLDFGANAFPGANRFLEIGVRATGGGTFTTLSPRQQITSANYGIRSISAATADTATNATQLGGVAANQYVLTTDTRLSDPRTPTAGSSNYIQNTNTQQAASNFNIAGNGTAGGTFSANIINATTQYNINGSRVLSTPGTSNTFVGVSAGQNNTGALNAFFGVNAGLLNTTAGDNAFFGATAGRNNTTGERNAFFGSRAGSSNTASDNSFFGEGAGTANTTGTRNSFFGLQAGFSNTTANDNSFFGYLAGSTITIGVNNSFFGSGSGQANTTGSDNSFFGQRAGQANTTGISNSFFGHDAGQANIGGSENAFFGRGAGRNNTTGDFNSFFGRLAGQSNTTANGNSFFGYLAGSVNTTGFSNAFFGASAGQANTTGADNAFFGWHAGLSNTTGTFNSFFGNGAGGSHTTGFSNAFFGASTGQANTTGAFNSFFGRSAGFSNTTGRDNAFFGVSSGQANTTEDGNTFIGAVSDGQVGITNATAIGHRASVTQSNSLVLGSINGVNGAAGDTNVGIGTTAPTDRLHVNGIIRVGTLGAAGATTLCRNASNQIATCASSLRYKANVAPFAGGLDILNRLRPISFTWKQGGMRDLGLGAEDVAAIEPLLVTRNASGEVEGVKYDRLNVVLINAIKQQQQQIEQQQGQLKAQQRQLEAARAANSAVSARLRVVEKVLRKKPGSARRRR